MAVITNIDADHMETYGHDFARLKRAFVDFAQRLPFYGVGGAVRRRRQRARDPAGIAKPIVTYGFGEDAQLRAVDVVQRRRPDALRRARPPARATSRSS